MSAKQLKGLTVIFGATLVGLVLCLGMTIFTGVRDYQVKHQVVPVTIPLPAM